MKPLTPRTRQLDILTALCGLCVAAVVIVGLLLPRTTQAGEHLTPPSSTLRVTWVAIEDIDPPEGAVEPGYISSGGYNVGR